MTRKIGIVSLLTGLVLFASVPTRGGLFESILAFPGEVVGNIAGPGIKSAFDPLLDGAASRLRETVDHAIDRASDPADAVVAKGIDKFGAVMKEEIDYTDTMAKRRLEQLDGIMETRLDQADTLIDKNLLKAESIAMNLLDREGIILDAAQTRFEAMVDQSLTRAEGLETDAFDRIDAALRDQVPFAASRVAREFATMLLVVIFAAVLVGYGGVLLLGQLMNRSATPGLRTRLSNVLMSLAVAGVTMALILTVIQVGYSKYTASVDRNRVERVEVAAKVLERVGDFKSAMNFRRRAFALDGRPAQQFLVARDSWLADFLQAHKSADPSELNLRLNNLASNYSKPFSEDGELSAARLYLDGKYRSPKEAAQWKESNQRLVAYEQKFLQGKQAVVVPVLGKLICMTRIRLVLDNRGNEVNSRLTEALRLADAMLVWYPRYAAGLVLRAQVRSIQEFAQVNGRKPAESKAYAGIETDLSSAAAIDPDLIRFVRLSTSKLPKELVERLNDLRARPRDKRVNELLKSAQESLSSYASELLRLAGPLLGSGPIARAEVERQIVNRLRRDLKEGDFIKKIAEARLVDVQGALDQTRRFENCMTVAENASEGDYWGIAEIWTQEAIGLAKARGTDIEPGRVEKARQLQETITQQPLSQLFTVF